MRVTLIFIVLLTSVAMAVDLSNRQQRYPGEALDRKVAAQFAPVIYQGLGSNPRADYITNFDFDGDWRGDNNWQNLENPSYPLRAYVYYSVVETTTHYFIHYAFFHPRDYKGNLEQSEILNVIISEVLKQAPKDPSGGLAEDVALSHENDLEGCLIVAEKRGEDPAKAVVKFVELMAHNNYLRYCTGEGRPGICESIAIKDQRPLIFIEPKGHGPSRYIGDRQQLKNSINGVRIYNFTGRAEDNDKVSNKSAGYDLVALHDTLWSRAQDGENETFGETYDYKTRELLKSQPDRPAEKVEQKIGRLGSAFRGGVGFKNKARPPWSWFDDSERERPRGEWFFDPASVIARHFNLGSELSKAYVYHPYFKIGTPR